MISSYLNYNIEHIVKVNKVYMLILSIKQSSKNIVRYFCEDRLSNYY